ncbi:unnamed protein product, partial [Penicillium discolor]
DPDAGDPSPGLVGGDRLADVRPAFERDGGVHDGVGVHVHEVVALRGVLSARRTHGLREVLPVRARRGDGDGDPGEGAERRMVHVPGQDAPHVRPPQHRGQRVLIPQLDRHGEVEHRGQGRMVDEQQRALRCRRRQLSLQPNQLRRRHLPPMRVGHRRIDDDDAHPPEPPHLDDRLVTRPRESELRSHGTTVVMVAGRPHDLAAERRGGRRHELVQALVGGGIAPVRQVSREQQRVGTEPRGDEPVEHLRQVRIGVGPAAVQRRPLTGQVRVGDVHEGVRRARVFGEDHVSSWSADGGRSGQMSDGGGRGAGDEGSRERAADERLRLVRGEQLLHGLDGGRGHRLYGDPQGGEPE